MVDLRFDDASDLAMPLGAAPDLCLGPQGMLAQLVDRRVVVILDLVGQRQVDGSKMRASQPKNWSRRAASSTTSRE